MRPSRTPCLRLARAQSRPREVSRLGRTTRMAIQGERVPLLKTYALQPEYLKQRSVKQGAGGRCARGAGRSESG
jgi:hypothetical protein